MIAEIFAALIFSVALTFIGSLWIDKLYRNCADLSFPEEIAAREQNRRPILFCAFTIFLTYIFESYTLPQNFFMIAAIFLLVLMTVTDFEQYMLFDAMTLPLAVIGVIFVWQMNLNPVDHAIAAAGSGGIFLLLALLSKGALGGGDVKLIAALGIWLGCEKIISAVLVATVVGGLSALLLIALKKKTRDSYFAYGPYFTVAAIYFLLFG
ncbi:MAG: A24 family peptidase [Selenomonadaceae bacterium]|nr:A24 family peptidase [Selenomonadaceae bacterium]